MFSVSCQICFYVHIYICLILWQLHLSHNILLFQEANTEKIFYGLDDIVGHSDIIIVCILFSVEIMWRLKFFALCLVYSFNAVGWRWNGQAGNGRSWLLKLRQCPWWCTSINLLKRVATSGQGLFLFLV